MNNTEILEEIKKIQESLGKVADSLSKVEKYLLRADLSLVGGNKDIVPDPEDTAEDEMIDDIDDTVPSRIDKGIMNEPNYFGGALPAEETNYEIGPETPIENNNSRQPVDVNLNNNNLFSGIIGTKSETKETSGIGFKSQLQLNGESGVKSSNNDSKNTMLPTFEPLNMEIEVVDPSKQQNNTNNAVENQIPSTPQNQNFENYEPSFDFVRPKTINPNQGPAPINVNPMNYSDKVDVPNIGNNINQN